MLRAHTKRRSPVTSVAEVLPIDLLARESTRVCERRDVTSGRHYSQERWEIETRGSLSATLRNGWIGATVR